MYLLGSFQMPRFFQAMKESSIKGAFDPASHDSTKSVPKQSLAHTLPYILT
jgi:hypothetical protein